MNIPKLLSDLVTSPTLTRKNIFDFIEVVLLLAFIGTVVGLCIIGFFQIGA